MHERLLFGKRGVFGRTHEERLALTPREKQCLQMIGDGYSHAEIAAGLKLRLDVVQFHLLNARAKLGTNSTYKAFIEALRMGILLCPCRLPRDDP